jgi:hypothetical protein
MPFWPWAHEKDQTRVTAEQKTTYRAASLTIGPDASFIPKWILPSRQNARSKARQPAIRDSPYYPEIFSHGLSMKMPPLSNMARQLTASMVSVLPTTSISEV